MRLLLDACYLLLLIILSPAIVWSAWRHGKYRRGLRQKLWGRLPARSGNSQPCVWLHAVSVGEVNLIATILSSLERDRPDVHCVVTTTTRTGYELAVQKYRKHTVAYCPLDFSWAVRRALKSVRPDVLLLTELELWPNLIREATRVGVRVGVINGRLSQRSHAGYRRIRWLMQRLLNQLAWIAVQTEEYAQRFRDLGLPAQHLFVTGSLKFDGAEIDRDNERTRHLRSLAKIESGDRIFLAGSTQQPEEEYALAAYRRLSNTYPQLRLILVPRHPERFEEVACMLDRSGCAWTRRSQIQDDTQVERVLFVDTVGELGAWWGLTDIAFVGGSMGDRGGQNMIEPAAYGAAVSFGPNTSNFRDVVDLLRDAQAAIVVQDVQQLTQFVRQCLSDAAFAGELGRRSREVVRRNLGATRRTFELIQSVLPERSIPDSIAKQAASDSVASNVASSMRKSA